MNKNLKTSVKWVIVVILTAAVAYAGFYFDKAATRPIAGSGTSVSMIVPMDTNHFLLINADSVTIKAASQKFFVLYKASGETITPTQTPPPLGWEYDTYYVFGPASVSSGKWNVGMGNPTLQITSVGTITVTEMPTEDWQVNIDSAFAVSGLFVWVFVLIILLRIGFYKW